MTRAPSDLEGWAQLCPTCLGKAGTNAFLRARLRHRARRARARGRATTASTNGATGDGGDGTPRREAAARARPPARAFPDDWFLRRGPFEHGAIHDTAWNAELDVVTRWIDGLGLHGRIDEPAAGTGFFSPLLAEQGELHASDEDGDALDLARDRLVAHRLLAHLHVADPWTVTEPGRADAVVAGFLTGRVRGAGLDRALASLRERLVPGGRLALIDLRARPAGRPARRASPGRGTTPRCSRRPSAGPGFDAILATTVVRPVLLPPQPGESGRRGARNPGAILRRDVAPREPDDRDGRLRRDGRGDDRRVLLRGNLVEPGQIVASHPRAERRDRARATRTGSASSRRTSRRSTAPT